MSDKVLNCLCVVPKEGQGRSEVSFHGCIICGEFVTGVRGEKPRSGLACLLRRRAANGAANLGFVCVVVRGWRQWACLRFPSRASLSRLQDKVNAFSCKHHFTFSYYRCASAAQCEDQSPDGGDIL